MASGTRKIAMQAIEKAVHAAGPYAQDVARILYGAMGIAIPADAAQLSEGPHTSYHRIDRQQAIDNDKNASPEGADAAVTAPSSEPAPPIDQPASDPDTLEEIVEGESDGDKVEPDGS